MTQFLVLQNCVTKGVSERLCDDPILNQLNFLSNFRCLFILTGINDDDEVKAHIIAQFLAKKSLRLNVPLSVCQIRCQQGGYHWNCSQKVNLRFLSQFMS